MSSVPVICEIQERIAFITLNQPEKRNPLSLFVLTTIKKHLQTIAVTPGIRVVIIRAMGTAFSAGHDLKELSEGDSHQHKTIFNRCTEVMESIRFLPQPVIAQVQGVAMAAGCQLVASCDLAVASENATFSTPGVKIGLFCTTPGVALSRAIGMKKAVEMLLTGQLISASEAQQIGLINRVVPLEELAEETLKLANDILTASAYVIKMGKQGFYEQLSLETFKAYERAQQIMVENMQDDDAKEGIKAFLEKRKPIWKQ